MIEQLKCACMAAYPSIPNKEDCIEIKRESFAPKGEYCGNCIHFCIDLEAKINPWNDEVERTAEVAKCKFFGESLIREQTKAPCGISCNEYKKCISCHLQTNEEYIKLSNKLGIPVQNLLVASVVSNLDILTKEKR